MCQFTPTSGFALCLFPCMHSSEHLKTRLPVWFDRKPISNNLDNPFIITSVFFFQAVMAASSGFNILSPCSQIASFSQLNSPTGTYNQCDYVCLGSGARHLTACWHFEVQMTNRINNQKVKWVLHYSNITFVMLSLPKWLGLYYSPLWQFSEETSGMFNAWYCSELLPRKQWVQ